MSGFYGRDKITIIPITKAAGTGALTRGVSFDVKVMIEDETNMISGGNGRQVISDVYIFVPPKTAIKKGDIIKVIERFSKTVVEPERTVIQASAFGDSLESHIEVYA